jgi:hypothetical protein
MKILNPNRYFFFIIPLLAIMFIGCDDDELEQDRVRNLLINGGSWNLQSATVDGVNQFDTYSGLVLTFSSTGFSSTNGGVAWPATGSWEFEGGSSSTLVRSDGISVIIETVTQKDLELTFEWDKTTFESGKKRSVSGQHTFVFARP